MKWKIICFVLVTTQPPLAWNSNWADWGKTLEKDVSYSTYHYLAALAEGTEHHYAMNLQNVDRLSKMMSYNQSSDKYVPRDNPRRSTPASRRYMRYQRHHTFFEDLPVTYICLTHSVLIRSQISKLRQYFSLRTLYIDDYGYVAGYTIAQIFYRYQILIELYNVIQHRYIDFHLSDLAPVPYMLFVYHNMLTVSHSIIHHCRMFHELRKKFVNERIMGRFSPFYEYSLFKNDIRNRSRESHLSKLDKLKGLVDKIRKEFQFGKGRDLNIKYVPSPEPKRSKKHDRIYGWSIEDWWIKSWKKPTNATKKKNVTTTTKPKRYSY